jgi:predicted RNA-binding protein YlxR (DUF448 family)
MTPLIRTCVVCRKSDDPKNMRRTIYQDGKVVYSQNGSGRGGWIHPNCVTENLAKKHFQFAFRLSANEVKKMDLSDLTSSKNQDLKK